MGNAPNAWYLLCILGGTAAFVWADPPRRAAWRARWRARRAERAGRRAGETIRDADLEALHRQYRTAARYCTAGHDPAELGPFRVPSRPVSVEAADTRPVLLDLAAIERARRN